MHQRLFLQRLTLLGLAGCMVTSLTLSASAAEYLVYFGTYTKSKNAKSKGIYVSRLDTATGKLTEPELAAEAVNPSFVALAPDHKHLYAVGEVDAFNGKPAGGVSAFSIDSTTGKLKLLNQASSVGAGPAHVNVDKTGKVAVVSNYGGGSVASLPIKADGSLGEAASFIQHQGSGADPRRQKEPHAHSANFSPDNRFVFVADLGMDKVMIYRLDTAKATLTANDPAYGVTPPGSGPRHFAFHTSGKYAYVINEMLCTVTAFNYDAAKGSLTEIQTISTLPASDERIPAYSTAEVQVHPSGKFLYGSNRGHNTIALFSIDQKTGKLTHIENVSTQGKTPRNFGIDPTGSILIAANQDTDNVVVYRIDAKTGKLTPTGQTFEVGAPVCVKFLPVK